MFWFCSALGSALLAATSSYYAKKGVAASGYLVAAWIIRLCSLPILGAFLWLEGWPDHIEPGYGWVLVVASVINLAVLLLPIRALECGELSKVLPVTLLSPLFQLILEPLLLGTELPAGGVLGVLGIIAGLYVVNLAPGSHWAAPFTPVVREPGQRYMLLAAIAGAFGGLVDRLGLVGASGAFYVFAVNLVMVVVLTLYLGWRRPAWRGGQATGFLAASGVTSGLSGILHMTALLGAPVVYVIVVKRMAALFGVLAGVVLLKERCGWQRLAGTIVMLVGVALVVLAKK